MERSKLIALHNVAHIRMAAHAASGKVIAGLFVRAVTVRLCLGHRAGWRSATCTSRPGRGNPRSRAHHKAAAILGRIEHHAHQVAIILDGAGIGAGREDELLAEAAGPWVVVLCFPSHSIQPCESLHQPCCLAEHEKERKLALSLALPE